MFMIVENNIITQIFYTVESVNVDPVNTPTLVGYYGDNEVKVGYYYNNGNPSPVSQ